MTGEYIRMVRPCSLLPRVCVLLLLLMAVMGVGEACLKLSTRHNNIYKNVFTAPPAQLPNHGPTKINCLIDFCNLTLAHPQLGENTLNVLRFRHEMKPCSDNCTANVTGPVCQHSTINLYRLRQDDGLNCSLQWESSFRRVDGAKGSFTSPHPSPTIRTSSHSQPPTSPSTIIKPHTVSHYSPLDTSSLRLGKGLGDDGALIIVPWKTPHLYVITKDRITKYKAYETHNFNENTEAIHIYDTLRRLVNGKQTYVQLKPEININQNQIVGKKVEGLLVKKLNQQVEGEVKDPSLNHYFFIHLNNNTGPPDIIHIKLNTSNNQKSIFKKQVEYPTPPKTSMFLEGDTNHDLSVRDGTAEGTPGQLGDDERMRQYPHLRKRGPGEIYSEEEMGKVDKTPSRGKVDRGTNGKLDIEGAGENDDGARMKQIELKQDSDSLDVSEIIKGKKIEKEGEFTTGIPKKKATSLNNVRESKTEVELKVRSDLVRVPDALTEKELGRKDDLSTEILNKKGTGRNGSQNLRYDELPMERSSYLTRYTDSRTVKQNDLQAQRKNEDLSVLEFKDTAKNDVQDKELIDRSDFLYGDTNLETVKRKDLQKENKDLAILERKDTDKNNVQKLLMGDSDFLPTNSISEVVKKELQAQKEKERLSILGSKYTGENVVQEQLKGHSDTISSNMNSRVMKEEGSSLHKEGLPGVKDSTRPKGDVLFEQKKMFDDEQTSRHSNIIPVKNIFTAILKTRSSNESILAVVVVGFALISVVLLMRVQRSKPIPTSPSVTSKHTHTV